MGLPLKKKNYYYLCIYVFIFWCNKLVVVWCHTLNLALPRLMNKTDLCFEPFPQKVDQNITEVVILYFLLYYNDSIFLFFAVSFRHWRRVDKFTSMQFSNLSTNGCCSIHHFTADENFIIFIFISVYLERCKYLLEIINVVSDSFRPVTRFCYYLHRHSLYWFGSMLGFLGGVNVIISCTSALDIVGYIAKFRITHSYNYFYCNFNICCCSS